MIGNYKEGFIITWNDSVLGEPLFGQNIYHELQPAMVAASQAQRVHGGVAGVVCSEHRKSKFPSGSCHYCAMLQLEEK